MLNVGMWYVSDLTADIFEESTWLQRCNSPNPCDEHPHPRVAEKKAPAVFSVLQRETVC